MKNIKYILPFFALALLLIGCDAETPGVDPESPASTANYPTPTFTLSEGTLTSNEEDETIIVYNIVMDKPISRAIDFSWVVLESSTATEGEDFELIGGSILAYQTTGQLSVKIYNDDLIEDTESLNLTIQSGPSLANKYLVNPATVYPTVNIQIENFLGTDLEIGVEWEADNGTDATSTELADLILLVTNDASPYTDVVTSSDGGSFEEVTLSSDTADGDYLIVVDVYALDDSDFDIDLTLSINQSGITNDLTFNFPSALNSEFICSNYLVLAKISKSGTNYTVTSENAAVVSDGTPDTSSAAPYIGTATVVVDAWQDYDPGDTIEIEAGSSPNQFYIRNYNNAFIANPDTSYMIVTIDPCGNVTVVSNEDFDYGCSEGDLTGTGTVNPTTRTIDLTLDYDLGDCGAGAGNSLVLQL